MIIIDEIINYLFISLFTLTPLIVFHRTSELFEFNKMLFIYLITTFILFFWFLKSILLRKIIIKKTPLDKAIIIFLISQILSTLFSIDPHTSFFGFYGRFNGGLLSLFAYIALYYALVSNLKKKQIINLIKFSVITAFVVTLIGLPGKLNKDFLCYVFTGQLNNNCWTEQFKPAERMFSTLGQPNWLGAYLTINFFLTLTLFLINSQKKTSNLFYLIIAIITFVGILFTRSRSAILSLYTGFFLFVFFIFILRLINQQEKFPGKIILFLTLTLFLLTLQFKTGISPIDRWLEWNLNQKKELQEKAKNKTIENQPPILVTESFDIRKIVWQGAIELGKKYPFFGTGVETFGYAYYFTRPKEHNLTSEWDYLYNKAHNEYLNYFATTGFFGLIAYLIFIFLFLFHTIKILLKKEEKILFFGLFLSYLSILLTNFFGFSTTTINLFFYLLPAWCFILSQSDENEVKNTPKIENFDGLQYLSLVGLIIGLIWASLGIVRYWLADLNYALGQSLSSIGDYYHAVKYFQTALSYKYEHVYEDKLSYSLANLASLTAYEKEKELTKNLINQSKFYNQKSIAASPKNILYWRTRAKNFYLYYLIDNDPKNLEEGIEALNVAKKIAPTDPKIPYTIAVFYSLLSEANQNKNNQLIDRAFAELNKAIDLKPNYRDAYFLKGQLLVKIGKQQEARNVFKEILNKINSQDEEVKKELKKISMD